MRHAVCAAEALAPRELRALDLDGRRVVLARAGDGSFHALADVCPHQGARLSGGRLGEVVGAAAVGETGAASSGEALRCPWHNFAFDLGSGCSLLEPERFRVRVYGVAVEAGTVVVEVPD